MYHKQPLATRIGRGVHGMAAPADRLCACALTSMTRTVHVVAECAHAVSRVRVTMRFNHESQQQLVSSHEQWSRLTCLKSVVLYRRNSSRRCPAVGVARDQLLHV